jgi:segregation and condensation protein B
MSEEIRDDITEEFDGPTADDSPSAEEATASAVGGALFETDDEVPAPLDPADLADVEDVEDVEDEADEDEGLDDDEEEVVIHDADAEDAAEKLARMRRELRGAAGEGEPAGEGEDSDEVAPGGLPRDMAELMAIIEALVFVSEEPLTVKSIADVLKEDRGWVTVAVESLAKEFNERNGGLMMREVAGGWQIATRPEYHEHVRAYLKSRPSAKLSLAALETLAVIAYKQPITVPEILEIRGVQSSSAIKTLLDKRLIVAKGRKETVGRPMLYGTSKEFLLQFGLKDLSELPSIEDFEDLAGGET